MKLSAVNNAEEKGQVKCVISMCAIPVLKSALEIYIVQKAVTLDLCKVIQSFKLWRNKKVVLLQDL